MPDRVSPSPVAATHSPTLQGNRDEPREGVIRTLYAEDDAQVAQIVQLYFEQHRDTCRLDVVHSGQQCLAAMQAGGYDVLLLDLMMPDLNGLQVLGELTARHDPTPVIMVSGQGQADLAVRALRAGAVDCIDKTSADFRRIDEIVIRTHQRQQRKRMPAPPPPVERTYQVLLLDPELRYREKVARFFTNSAQRLALTLAAEDALDPLLQRATEFDAIVMGPNLNSKTMLDALRQLRVRAENVPVLVISAFDDSETTIAAFKLGARDYLLERPGSLTELVFSLNNALKQANAERLAARLAAELAALNQSLADQVMARTAQLETEVAIRRAAEQRAEDHAGRLQALSTQILRVQEDERRSIAQELHDQIGQLLTGLRFQLETARDTSPSPEIAEALDVTDELLRSVRALTLQLRPPLLDDLGLKPALEWQTTLFQRQTGITIELDLSLPATRLAPELETAAFRMVQEALTNVARHSGAKTAAVTVTTDDDSLQVEITDRGQGFDTSAALARHHSLGLTGLAERVRLAGGRFELFSQSGHGTRLHAEFSLRPRGSDSP